MDEYFEVLSRKKFERFGDFKQSAEWVLKNIQAQASFFRPTETLSVITDEADNRLLELAAVSKADYLVTGNSNDFTMASYQHTKIVSPKEYWELYR